MALVEIIGGSGRRSWEYLPWLADDAIAEVWSHSMTDAARKALNEAAWRDFIMFAWMQDGAHAAFRGATNRPQRSRAGSPLDLLIDKAVGGAEDEKYVREFVDWVTREHWGENYAPEKWKKIRGADIKDEDRS